MRLVFAIAVLAAGCFDFDLLRTRVDGGANGDPDLAVGDGWKLVPGGTSQQLHGLWGVDDEVWAVGDSGTIIHKKGSGPFAVQPAPAAVGVELWAIWGENSDRLIAVGTGGRAYRTLDGGATWDDDGPTHVNLVLRSAWGDSLGNFYAVGTQEPQGTNGTIVKRTSNNLWAVVNGPLAGALQGVFGVSAGAAVFASGGEQVLVGSDTTWMPHQTAGLPSGNNYWGIFALDAATVYIASDFPYRLVGNTWIRGTMMPSHDGSLDFKGVFGFASGHTWVVGGDGLIYHRSGGDVWVKEGRADGQKVDLEAVWGASPSDLWAVGANGTVLHR